jgi:hypothetical protein
MPAQSFQEELANLVLVLRTHAAKQVLHIGGEVYSLSEDDFLLLEAVLENSTFIHELVASSTSSAHENVQSKFYARVRSVSRALAMRKYGRLEYWTDALSSAQKDELHTDLVTTVLVDLFTRQQTEPEGSPAIRDTQVMDMETGEVSESAEV